MAATSFGDLVILIPGILGSRLVRRHGDKTVTVWNFSIKHLPRLLREVATGGLVLQGDGVDPPDDGIEAADLFDFQVLPGFFGVDDYNSLLQMLGKGLKPGQLLTFPYDWRLSNRHAARRLSTFAGDALAAWKKTSGSHAARLWLVCHSMGGLVARYYCEALGGAEHTRAIITMGTPHRGSVRALSALVNGLSYGPLNVSPLVRSLPSVYELLPLFPVVRPESDAPFQVDRVADLYGLDPVTGEDIPPARDEPAGPARPRPQPLKGLERPMLKRALQFHAGIRVPAESRAKAGEPSPYVQKAFFNRRQRTPLSARRDGETLRLLETAPRRQGLHWVDVDWRGDGTVPSFSSVPIEWPDTEEALAVAEKHVMIPSGAALADTIFNWMHPIDVREMKGVSDEAVVELDVPVSILLGEDLIVSTAALEGATGSLDVENVESGEIERQPFGAAGGGEPTTTTFAGLAAGMHRVTVRPTDLALPPVSDYVLVVDPLAV